MRNFLILSLLLCSVHTCRCESPPIASTTNGQISGTHAHVNHARSRKVNVFNAIPFAEPPIGELRFMAPKKLTSSWDGIKDGTVAKDGCLVPIFMTLSMTGYLPQKKNHTHTYSEDCLNLNVYTSTLNSSSNMPVIVWIYGGGFGIGSNQMYDGTALASLHDVVVVIPNYRLNAFGFFSLGVDSIFPGNVGLLDQIMALKWIQENIENFGGDPARVTLMGESAGAVSIGHLMNADQAKGLFHNAILFSGVASNDVTLNTEEQRIQQNKMFFDKLGINDTDDDKVIMSELKKLDAQKILNTYSDLLVQQVVIYPSVDGSIIKSHPMNFLDKSSPVPSIVLTNIHEGMGLLSQGFVPGYIDGISEEMAKILVKPILKKTKPNSDPEDMYQKVKQHYLKLYDDDHLFYSKLYGATFGDAYFHFPAFQTALKHSEKTNVYYGYGMFPLRAFRNSSYSDGLLMKPDWAICDHGEDLLVSMGMPFLSSELTGNPKFTEEEKTLSERFMAYIANFATNGDPNVGVDGLPNWPLFTPEATYVLKIGIPDMTPEKNIHKSVVDFWSQDFTCNLVEYTASNIIGFGSSKIMIDPGFQESLNRLNDYAMNRKLTIVVMQSFLKGDEYVMEKSNILVGHAVSIKLKLRRRKLCGRQCLEGPRNKRAQKFISNLSYETGLQWQNDSKLDDDQFEIDDGMNKADSEKWQRLYKSYQEYC